MPQVLQFWSALDMRRRVIVVVATLAMFVTILVMSRIASAPSMALLYSGLEPAAAGQVVTELEARGIAFEVRGEAIFVPESQRDALRLGLAAEGLPVQGGAGYELLDSLTGFGTTTQMFDAAWTRAVEGELARTILGNPQIRAARVHIARGEARPFSAGSGPSASVMVTATGGLTREQAQALRHLVAAAVTGLKPGDVEVIDSVTGLIPPDTAGGSSASAAQRAEQIRRNVERLLEARVGLGRAIVEVSVELVTESELLTERRIDPQGRVAITSETESSSGSETGNAGAVTVASNLPDGDAGAEGGPQSRSQESREKVQYDISETRREVTRSPGEIRRLGVAVLLDGVRLTAEDGTESWQPRDDAELAALRDLIASAAGIDEGRGDQLTIRSMELAPVTPPGESALSGPGLDLTRLAGLGVLALSLVLVALLLRRSLRQGGDRTLPSLALPPVAGTGGPVLTGEVADGFDIPAFARNITEDGPGFAEDPVARLRRLIGERQAESIEILREWMNEDGRQR